MAMAASAPPIIASAALPALTIYSSVDGSASTACMPTYALNCVTEPRPAPSSSSSFDRSRSGLALAPQPRGVLVARARVFQCAHSHRVADGTLRPCQIRTKIMPYCARHTRELLKLEVRPSTIAGAGLGLFAALPSLPTPSVACNLYHDYVSDEDEPAAGASAASALPAPNGEAPIVFNNGDLIYYMEGELLTRPQYETRYGASFDPTAGGEAWFTPYAARLPDGRIVDAIAARGVLACANDPRDRAKVNMGPTCADRRPSRMPLFATRCVRAGDELFVSYGDAWWTAFPTSQSWAEAEARAAELGH